MQAGDLVALSVTEPTPGADNDVWGADLNVIISQLQQTVNNLITVVQGQDVIIQNLTGGSTGQSGIWL
jgi:hypothetical protein